MGCSAAWRWFLKVSIVRPWHCGMLSYQAS
uniref:Uncharacterized protein n=1 Tax=Arundo donax TaxID=35708 RepID=A0A0A8ZGQ4_ARUDO